MNDNYKEKMNEPDSETHENHHHSPTNTPTNTLTNTLNPYQRNNSKQGRKFRFIIHGVPKNKKYTVEEAMWCDTTQKFITEKLHTVSYITLRHLLGYIPRTIGGALQTEMWMYLPDIIYDEEAKSPIEMWESNKNVFAPFSFETLRNFYEKKNVINK